MRRSSGPTPRFSRFEIPALAPCPSCQSACPSALPFKIVLNLSRFQLEIDWKHSIGCAWSAPDPPTCLVRRGQRRGPNPLSPPILSVPHIASILSESLSPTHTMSQTASILSPTHRPLSPTHRCPTPPHATGAPLSLRVRPAQPRHSRLTRIND